MKRLLKLLINLVLAVVAVALTLLVLFILNPSWQKAALDELLARDTARQWQVGAVHLQAHGLEMEEVFVLDGPVGAGFQFVQLAGPVWKVPFTRVLEVREGSILGLDVDLSRVRVGDLTSEDYQAFLKRVAADEEFWSERLGVVLSKAQAQGLTVRLRNVQLTGKLLMPGNHSIPVRWLIIQADSDAPRMNRIVRTPATGKSL